MIDELKDRVYGWDHDGNPEVSGLPPLEEVIEKVNEIIRYLNAREGDHFREPTKMMEEEAQSWAGSSAVDAFIAGAEWQKKQDAARRK